MSEFQESTMSGDHCGERAGTARYHNPWIPDRALKILEGHTGSMLDVGGGAAPYANATHVLDIQPFDADRLTANCWGGTRHEPWSASDYSQLDVYAVRPWPFADHAFDLGLCSHVLEDLRDPVSVVKEVARVCKKALIITPSRLLAQTMGVEHPRMCGFAHHPWFVVYEGDRVLFRRKSQYLLLPRAHIRCPIGSTLRYELGGDFYYGENPHAEEVFFKSGEDEYAELVEFVKGYRKRRDIFIGDDRKHDLRFWLWRLRQIILGSP